MNSPRDRGPALALLRRFADRGAAPPKADVTRRDQVTRCELCAAVLRERHDHLLDPRTREMACACPSCALLFPGAAGARFRRLGRPAVRLDGFRLPPGTWAALGIPVTLAFFVRRGTDGPARVVACFPGPLGLVELHIADEVFSLLAAEIPAAARLEPEVEALLIRFREGEPVAWLLSVDECFRLTGILRTRSLRIWSGMDDWSDIDQFFNEISTPEARCPT